MRKIQLFKLSCTLFSISIGSFICSLGRITDCHNGSGTRDSWSWSSSNFYHEDTMDLSYTDATFHPIYSLQGISQSVLEVTIEMKQKKSFNYCYLLFQELWKATSFNLFKRDDVFEPPFYFHFSRRCTYFYLLVCYFIICSFVICPQVLISFSPKLSRLWVFSTYCFVVVLLLLHSFLWCCFCYGLFICCFGLSRCTPSFPNGALIP